MAVDGQHFRTLERDDEMVFMTVAAPRDAVNGAIQAALLDDIIQGRAKCGHVHTIMNALMGGPKTQTELMLVLGYTNPRTHYQADPVMELRNKGYIVRRSDGYYIMAAHFAFTLP